MERNGILVRRPLPLNDDDPPTIPSYCVELTVSEYAWDQLGSDWKGLTTAGRAEKELGKCEVALASSFFPLSLPILFPSSTREPVHRLSTN